ncbi:MAG: hypothetical protein IJN44_06730, partial [Clostridia bacterium]|nr:hypothetical protein [Clostridia bacterium]
MENYERHVIKTIVFAVMLVVMLGLAAGAGAACNHANSYTVLVQSATCCEPGWYDLVCSDCGATVQERYNEMPATGRHDDTQVQVKSPLCETDGEARFYCNVSGKLVKTEKIDKLGHKMESIGVDAPTCTEPGMIHLQCIRCRKTSGAVTEPATGHQFDVGYATAATCTEDGKNVLCCGVCGYEDVKIKPATGHQMKSVALVPSDCEREGLETLECTKPGCGFSEDKIVPKKDHDLKTVSVSDATCEAGGKVTWACTYCGFETYTLGEKALGHDMTGGAEEVPATCEKDGYYRVHCSRCDYYEEEIYPATGHFTAATYVPATCEQEGYHKEACGNCDMEIIRTIPKKDHDLKTQGALPADCERGERITWKCQNCDFVTYTVGKPALGHDMTGGAEEVPATCEQDGYYRVHCSRCDYYEEEIYPATGHFTAATYVPATCE